MLSPQPSARQETGGSVIYSRRDEKTRTSDLHVPNVARYQLCYIPSVLVSILPRFPPLKGALGKSQKDATKVVKIPIYPTAGRKKEATPIRSV